MSDIQKIFCPNCGSEQKDNYRYCSNCGGKLVHDTVILSGDKVEKPKDASFRVDKNTAVKSEEITRLQEAADYYYLKQSLKTAGIWSIIAGIVIILVIFFYPYEISSGYRYFSFKFFSYFMWGIISANLLIIAIGIWMLSANSRIPLLICGLIGYLIALSAVILVIFSVHEAVTYQDYSYTHHYILFALIYISSFPLAGGCTGYYRNSLSKVTKPTDEILRKIEGMIKPFSKADIEKQKDYIQINEKRNIWKVKLGKEYAIFLTKNTKKTAILHNDDFNITIRGELKEKKTQNVWLTIKGLKHEAKMGPVSWNNYRLWRQSEEKNDIISS